MTGAVTLEANLTQVFAQLDLDVKRGFQSGALSEAHWTRDARRWSHMRDYFQAAPVSDDPIIYEIYTWRDGSAPTDLLIAFTVLHPGRFGQESYHTKGHFHRGADGSEFVIGYAGEGVLETAPHSGALTSTRVTPGAHALIPSGHAHRMSNPSHHPLAFLSICAAGIGHDYDSVASLGWLHR